MSGKTVANIQIKSNSITENQTLYIATQLLVNYITSGVYLCCGVCIA
jgi:hypothetical protein